MKEYICHCGEVKELSDSTDIEFQICPKCSRMGEWEVVKMKAYAVIRTFKDGSKEGVLFTDRADALSALNGAEEGAQLAVEFTDMYGGEPLEMIAVEI